MRKWPQKSARDAKKICRIVFAFLRLFAAMLFSHDGFAFPVKVCG
jgi:hypothetical protein